MYFKLNEFEISILKYWRENWPYFPQAREVLGLTRDAEYSLLVGGVNVSIYCLGMNVTQPREYLTLTAGEESNYAEIYSKRYVSLRFIVCLYGVLTFPEYKQWVG